MATFNLKPQELAHLRLAHRNAVKIRHAYRINAVILMGTGWAVSDVADALLLDPDTLRRYVDRYQKGGVDKLLKMDYQGSSAYLNPTQIERLDAHLEAQTYQTVSEIANYIQNEFGITYSVSGLTDLLHRMDYTYKKTKLVPGKANAQDQHCFVCDYRKLRRYKGKNDPVLFMDAVHPQHNTAASYGWIKRGIDKFIKSNTGRKRLNISGVVNIDTMNTVTQIDDRVNAQSTIELLKQVSKSYRKAKIIHIICDNARYYHSVLVREYLEASRIRLHFLPPYSPNLNLIERLWKYFRKTVLHLKYYEHFDDFKKACLLFFDNIPKHKKKLKTLLTENFQILDASMA